MTHKTNKIVWTDNNNKNEKLSGTIIGKTNNFIFKDGLALFDLDQTIIKPKGTNRFSISSDDWMFNYKQDIIISKLKELIDNNYSIVIITNQAGIKSKKEEWMKKLNNIYKVINKHINLELCILCSYEHNMYRKPMNGFYYYLIDESKKEFNKIFKDIFYCGDAIGRIGDHSDCDIKFAHNSCIRFIHPDEFFLNKILFKSSIKYINFNKVNQKFNPIFIEKEIIVMVGYPASGKSTISKKYNELGYVIINQDTLKTKSKCIKLVEESIKQNKSIIIDSTNPSKESRNLWFAKVKNKSYKTKIIHMKTTYELSMHNNYYRYLNNMMNNNYTTKIIPKIAYNIFKSKYEQPDKSECDEIIELEFETPNDILYQLYLY